MLRNGYSYSFCLPGWIIGSFLLFFSLSLFGIELGRIYAGSISRGRNDSESIFQYEIYSDNVLGSNSFFENKKTENRWTWPWSTPTLLFSLVFLFASISNWIAAQRQSYSSILNVFISSIVSLCLLVFLIASYSTIVAGWKEIYKTYDGNSMSRYARLDRNLAATCLAISCVLFLLFLISLIASGRSISACSRKILPAKPNQYANVSYDPQI